MAIVNIESLTREAKRYNNVLRTLPYYDLNTAAAKLKLKILEVEGEDVLINRRRKAGILQPYKIGMTVGEEKELMKFFETKLKPELVFAEDYDDINSYKDKKVISNAGEFVNNKTKKHPLEFIILRDMVLSFTEDVYFNLFHAQRDEDVKSPATSFNGFYTKLNLLIAAGEVAEAKGNYRPTGAFDLDVDNPDPSKNYYKMVEWLKSADPLLRRGEVYLYSAENPMNRVRDGFRQIVKSYDYPSMEQVIEKLRSDANIPGLQVITDEALGTGDQLMLTAPGQLDFGVGKYTDQQFVQVRNVDKNPNIVQFWVQSSYDTRINDVHRKLFMTNDQKNTVLDLAGDY